MNSQDLTCRRYVLVTRLNLARTLRSIPVIRRFLPFLVSRLLPNTPVWIQVRSGISQGMWMRLNPQKDIRLWLGEHEPAVQSALAAVVVSGMVVYDVGAHVGIVALGMARLVGRSGRVVAFEPDPESVEDLLENRDRNGFGTSMTVVPSAVWSYPSSRIGFRRGGERRSHGGVELERHHPVLGTGEVIQVQAVTLDDFIAAGGLIPQLIKIDVEGGEHEVLRGGERLFSGQRPLIVVEVHHKQAADQIQQWLVGHQYRSRCIRPPEQYPCCLLAWPESLKEGDSMWGNDGSSR